MADQTVESVNLFYRAGSSDKVYQASIVESDGGYLVNFAYGRRGGTLKAGTKTNEPVPLEKARGVFEKLVASKTSKGYQPGGDVGTYTPDASEFDAVASQCQLLNPVEEADLPALIANPAYLVQEKYDGERLQVGRRDGKVYALNRKGKSRGFPKAVADAVREIPGGDFLLDGEIVGQHYFAFDALTVQGEDVRRRPYDERYAALRDVLAPTETEVLTLVETAYDAEAKRSLLERVRRADGEGVVFKHRRAAHEPGRPASGGPQLKFKLWSTATVRVAAVNAKRSVAIEMSDGGASVPVGNVTVPANHEIPESGTLIEVRYLYAYEGGSLYQPTLLRVRDDIDAVDSVGDLKFKPEAAARRQAL